MAKDKLITITRSVNPEKELTILTVDGYLSFKELMETLGAFYAEPLTLTKNYLWDFRNAHLEDISFEDVQALTDYIEQHGELRVGGKSAWVASEPMEYGMMRMAQTFGEIKKFPFEIKLFKSMDEAEHWLEEDE